jgi:hypothetical protein
VCAYGCVGDGCVGMYEHTHTHTHTHTYIYIYIRVYASVCVCVCVWIVEERWCRGVGVGVSWYVGACVGVNERLSEGAS